jgi:hypothetical protein
MVIELVLPVVAMTAVAARAVGGWAALLPQMILVGLDTVPANV